MATENVNETAEIPPHHQIQEKNLTLSGRHWGTQCGSRKWACQGQVLRTELKEESDTHNPRLTETTETRSRNKTKKYEQLSKLMATNAWGWPDDRKQVTQPLQANWTYRDELTNGNDLIYKGAKGMIPLSMQAEMLLKIHGNHFGHESTVRMVREVLFFWPGIRQAVFDTCMCNNCAQ